MIIYRHIIDRIKPWLGKEKIILLTGPRQVGKTTILKILEGKLKKESKTLFFSCDLEIGNPLFKDPKLFINLLEAELNANPKTYVFLDELQYIPQAGLFLKPVFDRLKNRIQFFVSGSSSLEISRSREFLTGRKIEFRITPFTFQEWLGISSQFSYPRSIPIEPLAEISDFYRSHQADLEGLALTYLNWGGYPEPAFEPQENKLQIIREIISTYLQRDIAGFLNISNLEGYNNLIRLLAILTGGLVNRHEISNTLRLNTQTLNKYLAILEGTYIFTLLSPFFTNIRKEISKMKKVYVFDPGVRRVFTSGRPLVTLDDVSGPDVENFIFTVLSNAPQVAKLHYYRTISKSEIDFVALVDGAPVPVEVKFRADFNRVPVSVRHFMKTYGEKTRRAIIVTRDYLGKEADVYFIPFVVFPFLEL
jgi:predicted AAA+ superfamily ATPase